MKKPKKEKWGAEYEKKLIITGTFSDVIDVLIQNVKLKSRNPKVKKIKK